MLNEEVKVIEINGEPWYIGNHINSIFNYVKSIYSDIPYFGYVYIVPYGDYLKIGCTKNPIIRIQNINSTFKNYSLVDECESNSKLMLLSQPHVNYYETEKILHEFFDNKRRKSGELFDLSLNDILENLPYLNYIKVKTEDTEEDSQDVKTLKNLLTCDLSKLNKPNNSVLDLDYCAELYIPNESLEIKQEFKKILSECKNGLNIKENMLKLNNVLSNAIDHATEIIRLNNEKIRYKNELIIELSMNK